MARILIVEDESAIADLIELNLELVGHVCQKAGDGDLALDRLEKDAFDLILLDVMLPGIDGFDLMDKVRGRNLPVIFLTARSSTGDKVKGLRLGADDYITKPFETAELLARVEAVLRRSGRDQEEFRLGTVHVDFRKREVRIDSKPVELTAQEFSLLEVLVKNRNIALSRDKLLQMAWGYDYMGETRTVDMHVQRLRRKLGFEDCLKTVYKYGYRLETPT